MKIFYFNTGVRTYNFPDFPYDYHKAVGNVISPAGILQIPFECEDVPEGATFEFACDNPDLHHNHYLVREIISGNMLSKYAYFSPPPKKA